MVAVTEKSARNDTIEALRAGDVSSLFEGPA